MEPGKIGLCQFFMNCSQCFMVCPGMIELLPFIKLSYFLKFITQN